MARARRDKGDGSVYQDAHGIWRASIELGYRNGKRWRKKFSGPTRREVVAKLERARKEHQTGVDVSDTQTVSEYLQRWIAVAVRPSKAPRTVASYEQLRRLYVEPHLGRLRVRELRPEQAQRFVNTLLKQRMKRYPERTLSARTVEMVVDMLHAAWEQARIWGYVVSNVWETVQLGRVESAPIVALTIEQVRLLLAAAAGDRLEALYWLALAVGLRKGELLGLRWSDLDWDRGTLKVTGQVQTVEGKTQRLDRGKTASSETTIPLPSVLLDKLRDHRDLQDRDRSRVDTTWEEHDLIFSSSNGRPISPRNMSKYFKGLLRRAGLPEATRFHDLRHSCVTLLISLDVHPKVISQIARHSSISVTMDRYGHVIDEQQRAASGKITELFRERKGGVVEH
ncbi:MAG TPA: site-specific integrase [Roseiflexaceae bacterium]|nr:site-specific integrase [Roseiflexaceae bacterium]